MLGGCARDDFQIGDLRQAGQNFVLDAIGEVGVVFFAAQVFKRQHGDGLFRDRSRRRLVDAMAQHEAVGQQ